MNAGLPYAAPTGANPAQSSAGAQQGAAAAASNYPGPQRGGAALPQGYKSAALPANVAALRWVPITFLGIACLGVISLFLPAVSFGGDSGMYGGGGMYGVEGTFLGGTSLLGAILSIIGVPTLLVLVALIGVGAMTLMHYDQRTLTVISALNVIFGLIFVTPLIWIAWQRPSGMFDTYLRVSLGAGPIILALVGIAMTTIGLIAINKSKNTSGNLPASLPAGSPAVSGQYGTR